MFPFSDEKGRPLSRAQWKRKNQLLAFKCLIKTKKRRRSDKEEKKIPLIRRSKAFRAATHKCPFQNENDAFVPPKKKEEPLCRLSSYAACDLLLLPMPKGPTPTVTDRTRASGGAFGVTRGGGGKLDRKRAGRWQTHDVQPKTTSRLRTPQRRAG